MGYAYLHHTVDDHSRLAHSEILEDDGKDTAAGTSRRDDDQFGTAAPRRGVGEVTGLFAPRRPNEDIAFDDQEWPSHRPTIVLLPGVGA